MLSALQFYLWCRPVLACARNVTSSIHLIAMELLSLYLNDICPGPISCDFPSDNFGMFHLATTKVSKGLLVVAPYHKSSLITTLLASCLMLYDYL